MDLFNLLIVQPIFNLLLFLCSVIPGGDFGVSIIIFTILIRLALWPLVKKQLNQTKLMQKMQPELARIKRESKGNKQLESMQMMELYKEHGVSPFKSILVLLIQLPIFIALYQVIQIFLMQPIEVTKKMAELAYGISKNFGPIKDLIANPDLINKHLFGVIDLTGSAFNPTFNIFLLILVLGAAVTQYIMSKQISPNQGGAKRTIKDIMKEAADGKQADQSEISAAMTAKMTKFMPIMMFFIMVGLPGALVLYYTVSNLVAVIQQRSILNKDSDQMDKIADRANSKLEVHKKATAKARLKVAQEAIITKIVAKDTNSKKSK